MKPRLLDLFCSAGGASMGYHRAGFDVVGVDINPQPRYPFAFHQGDAIAYAREHGHAFDAIAASPPCQAHTSMKTMPDAKEHPDLIPATRSALIASGKPYVIENVMGAPLLNPIMLCGTMFGLGFEDAELRRHRLFESNILLFQQPCRHRKPTTLGLYGEHVRNRKRTIGVYGEGVRDSTRKNNKGHPDFGKAAGAIAMDIDWMTLAELCQAIPPAYTEYLGRQLLAVLGGTDDALPR